ncbi:hypothetical protein BABINDRAFT_163493 [Babjeviella inositovora NRRL Y-12698]|uniref:Concentrative nucleoside transporter C-terminal domain-containing protein n=1 Tax=Babjeviella inositovora NRRL Y-12698 TaxID=984486 RepID=A0A1E3QK76_9ASCO|nr:uncharacterized protein BABINDRAFT_163493 [Babjeviella inositovora NRRL Y-12698]ODQ77482.1 hypothetical protein BABINDRAFT_163493 [Babjeviella inositovora NRRL Y-12698]
MSSIKSLRERNELGYANPLHDYVSANEVNLVHDHSHSAEDSLEKNHEHVKETTDEESKAQSTGIVGKARGLLRRNKWVWGLFWGLFFTSWWLSIIIQDKHRHKWLIPTILWGCIMLRIISWYSPILYWIFHKAQKVWYFGSDFIYKCIPNHNHRMAVGALITIATMMVATFVPTETQYSKRSDRAISFFGVCVALFGLWATSVNRAAVRWQTVIGGMLMQYIIALFVLRTKAGYDIFNFISTLARELLGFAKDGVAFVTNTEVSQLGMFFFTVLPAVIFFVSFVHIWFYFGVMQWAVGKFAYFFYWTLRVSGAEAVNAAAAPFIGIGESAILIKNLLPYLTKAEIHQIMCSGFATISGSVLVAYIGLGVNPQALVSSCVMSIPASLAVSKLRYPETEHSVSAGKMEILGNGEEDEATRPRNVLQAFSNGATLGLIIAATIMTQCLCIIGLVALINSLLTWFGNFWNIKNLTLELMASYLLYPVAWLLGAPKDELLLISQLMATKIIQNEFNGYLMLMNDEPYTSMSKRGLMIATYSLCGFANFGSVGTQVGVLGTLAPTKLKEIAELVMSALFTGAISTLLSTAVASMVIHDLSNFSVTGTTSN